MHLVERSSVRIDLSEHSCDKLPRFIVVVPYHQNEGGSHLASTSRSTESPNSVLSINNPKRSPVDLHRELDVIIELTILLSEEIEIDRQCVLLFIERN